MAIKNSLINWLKGNYEKLPRPITEIIGKVGNSLSYRTRYGSTFSNVYEELDRAEFLSAEEIEKIVQEKLFAQVNYAIKHVPYYRNYLDKLKIDSLSSISEFEKLPYINKTIIKENEDAFISDEFSKSNLVMKKTSGSTGMPLAVYMNKDTTLKEWAFVVHLWKRIGFNNKSSRLLMRELEDKSKGKCYFDSIKNEMRIDISDMSVESLAVYCKGIERFKPDFIHGYPSATLQLCQYIEKHGLNHSFKGVLPSSEGMSREELSYIRKILKCPVLSFYGHTERLVMAGQCECSEYYHVEPLYGYCELVDTDGKVIKESGITGEIVATGFCNTGMPLIRYKTGDFAQWGSEKCKCGRNYKIIKQLEGRDTEYLVDEFGKKISLTSFRYAFYEYHVKAFQFYQETKGKVEVRMVVEPEYCAEDRKKILEILEEDANGLIKFEVKLCDELSRKKSGKREMIIQNVNLP